MMFNTQATHKTAAPSLLVILAFLVLTGHQLLSPSPSFCGEEHAVVLEIDGAIGPAVSDYIQKGFKSAVDDDAAAIVLLMDTPGGLDLAMRDIIQVILNSSIPVIVYVFPDGARAASAGTYILYASHVAAMSTATNLGAATPIQIGGMPKSPAKEKDEDKDSDQQPASPAKSTLEQKIIHDAAAYIRSLADRHGRNGEWAEKAVRESVSLTANEALKLGVVDVVANDLDDLFQKIDGREVQMSNGPQVISTADLKPIYLPPTWQNKLLGVISNPNIAYILMLLGMYGLIYELANPGVFLPGVAGAISILLALYGFQILPINYSGLALIILGILLIVSEAFIPSFGSLGIGGIIAFASGSLILFDEESLRISYTLIAGTTLASAVFILWLLGRLVAIRKTPVRTGSEALIGMSGEVMEDCKTDGRIWLLGESWQISSEEKLNKGDKVTVISQQGLVLGVKKIVEEN